MKTNKFSLIPVYNERKPFMDKTNSMVFLGLIYHIIVAGLPATPSQGEWLSKVSTCTVYMLIL